MKSSRCINTEIQHREVFIVRTIHPQGITLGIAGRLDTDHSSGTGTGGGI